MFLASPQVYAVLGGVFISAAVSIYANTFGQGKVLSSWQILSVASLLDTLSAVGWISLSFELEAINRQTQVNAPRGLNVVPVRKAAIVTHRLTLGTKFVIAVTSASIGLAILPVLAAR